MDVYEFCPFMILSMKTGSLYNFKPLQIIKNHNFTLNFDADIGRNAGRHLFFSLKKKKNTKKTSSYSLKVQSNFGGSNTFGTMKISSRQG